MPWPAGVGVYKGERSAAAQSAAYGPSWVIVVRKSVVAVDGVRTGQASAGDQR